MRRYLPVLSAAAVLILVDQLTKHWAVSTLCSARNLTAGCTASVDLVAGLEFKLAFNQGMAFSQFSSSGALIGVIGMGIVAGLLWFARLLPSLWSRIVVGLVIGLKKPHETSEQTVEAETSIVPGAESTRP